MDSIFDAVCNDCRVPLEPVKGWLWTCPDCGRMLERCGAVMVERERTGRHHRRASPPRRRVITLPDPEQVR